MVKDVGVNHTGGSRNPNKVPLYSPRLWHGMRLGPWLRLITRNRFAIHPMRIPMAIIVTACALFNSTAAWFQHLLYGRRIAKTQLKHAPVFIVGHWRSGTTFLHELLALDQRVTYPTTYECCAPDHFLVSSWIVPIFIGRLLPRKRPMDDIEMGLDRPQEDELALCTMGAPSPMARLAFPNNPPPYGDMLNMDNADPGERVRWQSTLSRFVRSVSMTRLDKRMVLKSPPHTGRIAYLAEMFPGAQFVHLARDPLAVFGSTIRLWKTMDYIQGFQVPRYENLVEYVFESCERMYDGYENQRSRIDPHNLYELRYEDLVDDPVGEVAKMYDWFHWDGFDEVRGTLENLVRGRREYRASHYDFPPELEAEIRRRWSFYFERYGYGLDRVTSTA